MEGHVSRRSLILMARAPPRSSLASALAAATPALLTDSPWPPPHAAAHWTPADLPRTLDPVRVVPRSGPLFSLHSWHADLNLASHNAETPGGFEAIWTDSAEIEARTMQTDDFFRDGSARHFYSGALLDAEGMPPPSLSPLEPLLEVLNNASDRSVNLKAWFGSAGAHTPLHYDSMDNVYLQMHGEKIFELLPPEALDHTVHLFPRIHPLSHFARPRSGDAAGSAEDHPTAGQRVDAVEAFVAFDATTHSTVDGRREAMRVRLSAGDVLYIPPFWAHAALCERACIAANVWVSSQAMHAVNTLEQLPLPFESHWSVEETTRATLLFLRWLLRGSEESATHYEYCAPIERLLDTRWRNAHAELFVSRREEAADSVRVAAAAECSPQMAHDGLTAAELLKLRTYAERRAAVLATIDARIRPTLLADQLERVAHWATGGAAIATHALLLRLGECCATPLA